MENHKKDQFVHRFGLFLLILRLLPLGNAFLRKGIVSNRGNAI
ncbi:hypothetical protein CHCC20335_0452 [Bacillus paralicheniformis]|nr:hypothetical protein CHCC20335_0452 [Bacillus paralicheniformis]